MSPDELEQRQRADGTFEAPELDADAPERVADPDVMEQHQRPDGTVESDDVVGGGEVPDHPLSPDEIEQRLTVEDDEDERPRD